MTLTAFSPLQHSPGLGYVPVRYDYEDFSKVDHRLQLFCEISVFQKSDERLLALAKVCNDNDDDKNGNIFLNFTIMGRILEYVGTCDI